MIVGSTPTGRATAHLLDMNRPLTLAIRKGPIRKPSRCLTTESMQMKASRTRERGEASRLVGIEDGQSLQQGDVAEPLVGTDKLVNGG